MKLIEAKTAKEFASTLLADPILKMAVYAVLDKAPEFDLVRCKDCKHYMLWEDSNENKTCAKAIGLMVSDPNDFCSYGERKDG